MNHKNYETVQLLSWAVLITEKYPTCLAEENQRNNYKSWYQDQAGSIIYPKKWGILIPCSSAIDLTMIRPVPNIGIAPMQTAPRLMARGQSSRTRRYRHSSSLILVALRHEER